MKLRTIPWTTPYREGTTESTASRSGPRGHQNSSAALLMTQSAPNSVAASRAILVMYSDSRYSSRSSRITTTEPFRA